MRKVPLTGAFRADHADRMATTPTSDGDRRPRRAAAAVRSDAQASSLAVVIRAAGERTAEACRALAAHGAGPVIVVEERPFERALRGSFTRALEAGCEWTLMLDGDVLPRPGAYARLLARARRLPASVFQVQGLVYDKLLGSARKAGNRLYRTSLLATALEHVPPTGVELRPETHVCLAMARQGHASQLVDEIVGLHDYEQFHRDIYRKAHVFAHKHAKVAAWRLETWAARARDDADCLTALHGFCAGLAAGFRGIDVAAYPADLREVLGADFREKPPLDPQHWTPAFVEKVVTTIRARRPAGAGGFARRLARAIRTRLGRPREHAAAVLGPAAIEALRDAAAT